MTIREVIRDLRKLEALHGSDTQVLLANPQSPGHGYHDFQVVAAFSTGDERVVTFKGLNKPRLKIIHQD